MFLVELWTYQEILQRQRLHRDLSYKKMGETAVCSFLKEQQPRFWNIKAFTNPSQGSYSKVWQKLSVLNFLHGKNRLDKEVSKALTKNSHYMTLHLSLGYCFHVCNRLTVWPAKARKACSSNIRTIISLKDTSDIANQVYDFGLQTSSHSNFSFPLLCVVK